MVTIKLSYIAIMISLRIMGALDRPEVTPARQLAITHVREYHLPTWGMVLNVLGDKTRH